METRTNTVKILDNTVISASLREIVSINLLERCSQRYDIVTSQEVYEEAKRGFTDKTLVVLKKIVMVENLKLQKDYSNLIGYLEARYPYLHTGELSSFLLALLKYELNQLAYFYITDDNRAKKVIREIHEDSLFIEQLGMQFSKINITGTIGLIQRLKEHWLIKESEIESIILDLEKSTFYINSEIIVLLRGDRP